MHAQLATTFLPLVAAVKTPPVLMVALMMGLLLAGLLSWLGRHLLERDHVDDFFRTVLTIFTVCSVLAFIPVVAFLGHVVENLYTFTANKLGLPAGGFGFFIIAAIMGGFGVWLYYRTPKFANLAWMTLLLSPLFKTEFVMQIVDGWVNKFAVPLWNFVVDIFTFLMSMHL